MPNQGALLSAQPYGAARRNRCTRLPPARLGGAEFGWHVDLDAAHRILDAYYERGGNALNTRRVCGRLSEHIIGAWIVAPRGARRHRAACACVGTNPDHPGLGPVNLIRAVEASLMRLDTDRIDVLTSDATGDSAARLEDTLATAEWLIESARSARSVRLGLSASQLADGAHPRLGGLPAADGAFDAVQRAASGRVRRRPGRRRPASRWRPGSSQAPLAHGITWLVCTALSRRSPGRCAARSWPR
ncbi:MAG: aldo/keto reductase [Microbacterium sp.]